jgi:hypothetical protein
MIWIGWNPTPFLERMEPSVRAVLERVETAAGAAETAFEPEPTDPGTPVETDATPADADVDGAAGGAP